MITYNSSFLENIDIFTPNELFQEYTDASEIYINSRMTIEDLKTFNIATERADDDKMGGVFVFLLMYCLL